MGYAAPYVKFAYMTGDESVILVQDLTEKNTSSTSYINVKNMTQVERITTDSILHLEYEFKRNGAGGDVVTVQIRYDDGVTETTLQTRTDNTGVYQVNGLDIYPTGGRGSQIRVYYKASATADCYIKNIKLKGLRSPYV